DESAPPGKLVCMSPMCMTVSMVMTMIVSVMMVVPMICMIMLAGGMVMRRFIIGRIVVMKMKKPLQKKHHQKPDHHPPHGDVDLPALVVAVRNHVQQADAQHHTGHHADGHLHSGMSDAHEHRNQPARE